MTSLEAQTGHLHGKQGRSPQLGTTRAAFGSEKRSHVLTATSGLLWMGHSFGATPRLSFASSRCSPERCDHCVPPGRNLMSGERGSGMIPTVIIINITVV